MAIQASDWYDRSPDLSRLEQGDVLDAVPVVFGPPKSKRWILLRPLPRGSPIETAESGLPKSFRGDVDTNFSTGWTRPEELVLARAFVGKIMIVSQSCDISWRSHIQVAPVGVAENDFKGEKFQQVLNNEIGYLFALPGDPPDFPPSYADLSRITAVDGSYFRPDALVKRLTSRAMMELQSALTDFYGRPIGFNIKDDVPQTARYACASCFTEGRQQVPKDITTGSKFPNCPSCGERALWIKLRA